MWCFVKSIFVWAVLWLFGTNLIGFIVRGFSSRAPEVDAPTERMAGYIQSEMMSANRAKTAITIAAVLFAIGYLFALYSIWNAGMAAAGLVFMLTRLPDLLCEIRYGRRAMLESPPRGLLYALPIVVDFALFGLVWWSLCGKP